MMEEMEREKVSFANLDEFFILLLLLKPLASNRPSLQPSSIPLLMSSTFPEDVYAEIAKAISALPKGAKGEDRDSLRK